MTVSAICRKQRATLNRHDLKRHARPENRLAQRDQPLSAAAQAQPGRLVAVGAGGAGARRKRAGKPILLSVGYAACHWCHVMAHESFEDAATAAVMNELFVNIKVDREERPDIDQIYMAALHHLGEQGGWPLTMFLTPDGEPVWGGTYFPKTSRYGRPAFVDVLREVARLFREEPDKIEQNRDALMARLADARAARRQGRRSARAELDQIARPDRRRVRPGARRPARRAEISQRRALRAALARRAAHRRRALLRRLIELTLDRICEGGIYDHLGGGFSRYSVDERWLVPHFEKMLYDNAQLLELLALAHRAHRQSAVPPARDRDRRLARARDDDRGGGVLRLARCRFRRRGGQVLRLVAGRDRRGSGRGRCRVFCAALRRDRERAISKATTSSTDSIDLPRSKEDETQLAMLRDKLLTVRSKRVRPGLDDKVLADWNGLMIAALVNAGAHVRRAGLDRAWPPRAFDFIARAMTRGDRLGHSWRDGRLLFPGLASDFAAMIRAALALYEATGAAPISTGRWPGSGRSTRTTPTRQRRLLPHRRRRRGPGGAAGLDHRRRHAQPERASPRKT